MPTSPTFAPPQTDALPLYVIGSDWLNDWLSRQVPATCAWLSAMGFTAGLGQTVVVPSEHGNVDMVAAGWGSPAERARGRLHFGSIAAALPAGTFRIAEGLNDAEAEEAALAFLLQAYRFPRYKAAKPQRARLVAPERVDVARIEAIAAGAVLAMDLINTPASDMGPDGLQAAAEALAADHGASVEVTAGEALERDFPMIHAVGRAAATPPRLIDMSWGDPAAPAITLVGKGVCFDTGGLDLKPAASMGLMKKDMGGAANVLGLARMVMATGLRVRLRVLIPAVENAVSGNAFRPQDILTSRKKLTVEVNNTDAEGRLVLADALALADEARPEAIFCLATLTGAARVALGPDLPAYFTDDDGLAGELDAAAGSVADPLWRLPFWRGYESMIEPDVADLDNAPKGGMAGAITAALFLRRFVTETPAFAHFDIYGWTPTALPGRPKGGACQAARAIYETLRRRYGTA